MFYHYTKYGLLQKSSRYLLKFMARSEQIEITMQKNIITWRLLLDFLNRCEVLQSKKQNIWSKK